MIESRTVEAEDEIKQVSGMFRIPDNSVGLTIEEDENIATIGTDWAGSGVNLHVKVSRRTSVKANVTHGDDLLVSSVSGQQELSNVNGSIEGRGLCDV